MRISSQNWLGRLQTTTTYEVSIQIKEAVRDACKEVVLVGFPNTTDEDLAILHPDNRLKTLSLALEYRVTKKAAAFGCL
jgi:hypothetical protein